MLSLLATEGAHDAERAIREKARALVYRAREFGWKGPPFDPHVLASLNGIRVREGAPDMEQDALIRPIKERELEIVFNPVPPETRQRFSICHEIAHTLFPDAYEIAHYRHDRKNRDPGQELESLCDLAAAEMLLPAVTFEPELATAGASLATMDALRERYNASREAVLLRIAALSAQPLAVGILTLRHKPTEERKRNQGTFDFLPPPQPNYGSR